jgi:hypothetical protein
LIDLEQQALEERAFLAKRKAIFGVVIRPVPGMAGRRLAIARQIRLRGRR